MLYPNGSTRRPRVSSPYGPRDPSIGVSGFHFGADLIGFPIVRAAAAGKVTFAGWMNNAAGNTVVIDHGDGVTTVYMHNKSFKVRAGKRVTAGQPIAEMGSTGNASGLCSHFEVRVKGRHVDPLAYVASTITTNTTGDEEMLQNIKGKAGKRSGGTWLLKDGQATFLGHDPKNTAPYIEDEGVIRNLAKHYDGLPA
ncbi:MAG: M23 family metallopeptidase [Microbacterium sp.]